MTWGKVPQEWPDDERTEELSTGGIAMWAISLAECNRKGNNGLMSPRFIATTAPKCNFTSDADRDLALRTLVSSGSWHDGRTARRCDSAYCQLAVEVHKAPSKGSFMFHEWARHQPTKDQAMIPLEHLRWLRDNDLKHDRKLCAAIQNRDRLLCRYCCRHTNWKDRRGGLGGTWDHVDPFATTGPKGFGNTLENVVVACRRCNGHKRDHPVIPVPGAPFLGLVEAHDDAPTFYLWPAGTTEDQIPGEFRVEWAA